VVPAEALVSLSELALGLESAVVSESKSASAWAWESVLE